MFTVTRTSSLPARASAATWRTVAATSAVSVFVMDWTTIGCPGAHGHAADTGGDGLPTHEGRHGREYNSCAVLPGPGEIRACQPPTPRLRRAPPSPASRPIVPERRVTNADLATRLDTSDDWIVTRTGIRERRIGGPGETTSSMSAEAVRRLMAAPRAGPDDVGALIVATVTPDMMFPATACLVQDLVGLREHLGLRPLGGVLRLSVRAHDRRPARGRWSAPPGDRGGRGPDERHHRPARSHDRGAVRRWGGRRAARAG